MGNNKTLVIITGCNRGLGKEVLSTFKSYDSCCINRKEYAENDCVIDLSKSSIDLNLIREKVQIYSIVVFINNASTIQPISKVSQIDVNDIDMSMYINYINPAKIITTLIKLNKQIVVINITSGAAFTSNTELALYSSSKAAMHRYIDILAQEENGNEDALLITNFDPGRMNTDMQRELIRKKRSDLHSSDFPEPIEVAREIYDLVYGVL